MKEVAIVFVVIPSPKFQNRFVIVPVELSVKVTVSGFNPLTGTPVKLAEGTTAPTPVIVLVLLPSLPVVTRTTLLKLAALPGAKRTIRFVEPKPGRLKGLPERIVNGPPLTVAMPLLNPAPPKFVIVKVVCELAPTAMVPKLKLAGLMASWAGVTAVPVTLFELLPPLLVKVTMLLKLPADTGAKLIATMPVWPGARLKGLPLRMAKGKIAETFPVSASPPEFITWIFCVLV